MEHANTGGAGGARDPFALQRFVDAQHDCYDRVLAELRRGRKKSHWMWFIFPQLDGLGRSSTARYYAIADLDQARQYLYHPVLGRHLAECCRILLASSSTDAAEQIFGNLDALKLRSSMTLFALASDPDSIFSQVLARFFGGEPDGLTRVLLNISD